MHRKPTGNHWHHYFNPEREVDVEAVAVHGLDNQFLADKPVFAALADDLLAYLDGAELLIHNAPFDVGFLNAELQRLGHARHDIRQMATVTDTLVLARHLYPGQRNSLDALCRRLGVDNTGRTLHGALLDAELLADVYLAMTGGQTSLGLEQVAASAKTQETMERTDRYPLPVIAASAAEISAHQAWLERLGSDKSRWSQLLGS